ncbi:hypothetical protein FA13DRAFT_1690826 [Coprinellus micaceus]|uniref:Uncharacterized protein n=1 Tax=Coprinellus micaceus TaxID=71717 RepID=A0A4Y7T215_COPMI|nr:hypothetical protein FA13DRAFT_1690826 [Coprinellus micaceus]
MRSFISLLPLLAAISGIFVGCHPLAGSPNNLAQRADGYASSFPGPAPKASFSPTDAELEGRQVGEIIEIAGAIVSLIGAIEEAIADSNVARAEFTKAFIKEATSKYPTFNWVICHVEHETLFDGVKDQDWGHDHRELDGGLGTTGYEIYWFKSGTFVRYGDGGYINWAFGGYVTSETDEGGQKSTVVFAAAP